MDRRNFLKETGSTALAWMAARRLFWADSGMRLLAAEASSQPANQAWTDPAFHPKTQASSYFPDPPGGYNPANVLGKDMNQGWQTPDQMEGAWLEIEFPEAHPVQEIWIVGRPLPRHLVGAAAYMDIHPREQFYAPPRRVRCTLADGSSVEANLRDAEFYQIVTFPEAHSTRSVRISIEEVWKRPGVKATGIGKVKVFSRAHTPGFEIDVHTMYDARKGQPLQTATLHLINPGERIAEGRLIVSRHGVRLMEVPLDSIPGRAAAQQSVWIPAPFQDEVMEFKVVAGGKSLGPARSLRVPAYRHYLEGGTYAFNCMAHNDLGWLDTQAKTADYRCARIILPAVEMLERYPEFRFSMESTVYLMEFLERYPEKREALAAVLKDGHFGCGATYVQCQEEHVGPEKLARQFYLGRRWLRKNFPGTDTKTYFKTDPPSLTLQMPQILAKAGVKYLIQGRMPFGYYWWQAPDGSSVFTYALASPPLPDPQSNKGWLYYAADREAYYAQHRLPPELMFDFWTDYLAPQPSMPPYVREQNAEMKRFAEAWNRHYASEPPQQVHPPRVIFTHPEEFLDSFAQSSLDIPTLRGDWAINWAYYDEPGHRNGLLAGRLAHNRLLIAERIYAGLSLSRGFGDYPEDDFAQAWHDCLWPDHGWGGNRGPLTDSIYVASYEKSQKLADQILENAGLKLAGATRTSVEDRTSLVVFNPMTWERSDLVQTKIQMPSGWKGFSLRDDSGAKVPYEIVEEGNGAPASIFAFIAEKVPSLGYRRYHLEAAAAPPRPSELTGDIFENQFYKVKFGAGGIRSLYDKRLKWEVLQTDKIDGGEVLQFTAPGFAWDDKVNVTLQNFDKTSNHAFPFKSFTRTPLRATAVREAAFKHFTLRETFHFFHVLDRLDIEVEVVDWDGQKERELRVAFPINLKEGHCTYEVPFGKVELGKDELNFSLLPPDKYRNFTHHPYGGDGPLPFREAINWVDASDMNFLGHGCLAASDCTVHLFRDETADPAAYPVLQHVLLSTRKSIAWNPFYWFTQKGSYRYRMSLLPHKGDWRLRYRDAWGFNYPLVAFVSAKGPGPAGTAVAKQSFFQLAPDNLVLTTLKKTEDDEHLAIRFYEAEGFECEAQLRFAKPVRQAWMTNLIEDEEKELTPHRDGSVRFPVRPWEIVTLKVAI